MELEDDIRDGVQGAFTRKPDAQEMGSLVELSHAVGCRKVVVGFPAASPQELDLCRSVIARVAALRRDRPIIVLLARSVIDDVAPIIDLAGASGVEVRAELYIGVSPVRMHVEGWSLEVVQERLHRTGAHLHASGTPFGVSLEDASRAPAELLERLCAIAVDVGCESVTLCDTVGELTPDGAERLTRFVRGLLDRRERPVELVWHGHNDKGLAVANALAAARAGADTVSGAFLGLGERAGNTPLEQIAVLLSQSGNTRLNLGAIAPYARALAECAGHSIPPSTPIVGRQAFATGAGTHSAAILKARALGPEWEDHIFSGVAASSLGARQEIIVGPLAGRHAVAHVLGQLGYRATERQQEELIAFARTRREGLTSAEILAFLARQPADRRG
ncbi:MAG: hypothetical protein R3B09_25790 [Nannocystaceae bacterium]